MEKNKPHNQVDRQKEKPDYMDLLILGIAWVVTLTAMIVGYAPLLLSAFFIIFLLSALIYRGLHASKPLILSTIQGSLYVPSTPLTNTLFAFSAYIALSSLWSSDIATSINKAVLVALMISGCLIGYCLTITINKLQLHRFTRGVLIGTLISLIFPAIELTTNLPILNFIAERYPDLIKTVGAAQQVPGYRLNRSVTALVMFFWPALLIAYLWVGQFQRTLFAVLLVGLIIPSVFLSESETAKSAFMIGSLSFAGAYFFPRPLFFLARAAWMIAVIGAVPIVMALHWAGVQNNTSLAYSARDRIHIWNYTAEQVIKNPILGIGIRSSRFYKKQTPTPPPLANNSKLRDHQGWHSHNIFLQIWYELGAVGAGFLLAFGLLILRNIKSLETRFHPFAYAGFASFGAVAAFGYGMWQSWLLACFGWTVIFFLFAFQYAGPNQTNHQN